MSFTISFINNDFILRALALENKPISGNQIAAVIIESLERSMELWNLPKAVPVFAVRDNGLNIKSAICGSAYYDIPCFFLTLQLAIGDAVDACYGMKNMLSTCRKIVGHYNHSCDATSKLQAKMTRLGGEAKSLVQSYLTRWNSNYYVVDRLLQCKEAICAELAESDAVYNLAGNEWKLASGYQAV